MMIALFLALALQNEADLAKRCGSQIPWIADPTELIDMELAAGHHPQYPEARVPRNYAADRAALLARARKEAAEKKRLILWYVPRMPGLHMYRAVLLDQAMRAVAFTDPGVVEVVNAKFVPLRMCCDAETSAALKLRPFDVVEPALVFVAPDGKVVHVVDKIRTFNADWFRAVLLAVLRKHPEYDVPMRDDASPAVQLRRAGKFEEVLKEKDPVQKGIALLGLKRFDEARAALEKETSPEALYHRAAVDAWTGKDPAPRLRELARKHPDSPWAWRAAMNLVKADDSLPAGPLAHHLEDFFLRPPDGVPSSTNLPSADADEAARRAVDWLLRAQHEDGSWRDARYAFWPTPEILPNVWGAVTALSALALLEHRALAPERIDAALARADAWLRDDARLAAGKNEESYAQAFRLHYFAARRDRTMLDRLVARVGAMQDKDGHWPHEYQNPFSTAVVVHALATARKAGTQVPEILFRRAADALVATRGEENRQAYRVEEKPDNPKSSSSRTALCQLALHHAGRGTLAEVAAGLDGYWKFTDRMEAVRLCDYHSDGRLAGFFYFHAAFHALEAARALDGEARAASLRRLRERTLLLPEWDGSFIDSHEIGKSYGTAMALLLLSRTR
jgi:hypothetical protein